MQSVSGWPLSAAHNSDQCHTEGTIASTNELSHSIFGVELSQRNASSRRCQFVPRRTESFDSCVVDPPGPRSSHFHTKWNEQSDTVAAEPLRRLHTSEHVNRYV